MTDEGLLHGFVQEARDFLDEIEPSLIELKETCEQTGDIDKETIDNIFRLFHSMKGSAGFLQLNMIGQITHEAETFLDIFRKGKAKIDSETTALLFKTIDLLQEILTGIEENLNDLGFDDQGSAITEELKQAINRVSGKNTIVLQKPKEQPKPQETPVKVEEKPAPKPEAKPSIPESMVMTITDDMKQRFVQEADELMETAEEMLLGIERSPDEAQETINSAFRNMHSFKGNCGFMGLADLEKLSHKAEEALEGMKSGQIEISNGNISVLLSIVDVLRDTIADVSGGGEGVIQGCDVMMEIIEDMIPSSTEKEAPPPADTAKPEEKKPEIEAEAEGKEKPKDKASDKDKVAQATADKKRTIARRDIRVDLSKLDSLINLIGELVIAESMVTNNPDIKGMELENFERATHQLHRITSDLQDIAMSVRMIPLSATFRKMIRLVHDVSNKAGKLVKLELIGEDTEVDKTVIEQIGDPLVHIMRNSADHGVEPPQERLEAGKPEQGSIVIEGRHEGGEVWIIIRDDGRGLNKEKIYSKAIERGLIEEGAELSDEQIYRLIFEAGFSTADKVSDVSGRGVGMDVVKRNIEKLRGRIDVKSTPGKGTTIILRIPLTLAIIEGMLIRVGSSCYTIPMLSVRESIRPAENQITITPDGQEVIKLREELLPVLRMHKIFNKKPDITNLCEGILVVVEDNDRSVCLFIDEIIGQQQTVIKGLSDYIGDARGISGCTILGDGQVSLILDIGQLFSTFLESANSELLEKAL